MKSMSHTWRATLLLPAALAFGCDQPPTATERLPAPRRDVVPAVGPEFVTRAGIQLRLNGAPFYFTGFNIYNANSANNCWYTMASGSALDDALTEIGPGKAVFRSWFFQFMATTGGQRDWSAFDHTLSVARAHGVKVLATLTNQWADCEPAAGYKDETWYTTGYAQPDPGGTASYRDWVAEVVTRYRDDPTIFAWQLVNEAEVKPVKDGICSIGAAAILKSFATDVSGLIKSLDANHLVSLGTIGNGQCGAQGDEYRDVHSVASIDLCEFHDYDGLVPIPGDQFNGLQVRLNQCTALGKPLFVGETGIIPNDVGGTLAKRATALNVKLKAQFAAGIVGDLVWAWSNLGSTLNSYDVGPKDPLLKVLARLGTPTHLAFTVPPVGTAAGQPITPAVQVTALDALNAPAFFGGSITITFGANPAGGTLSGTTTITADAGTATFSDLVITKAGSRYKLKASAAGLTAATSPPFIIGPAPAAQIFFTGQPKTTKAGVAIAPIKVTARDAFGNTAAGFTGNVTLTIATNPSGGTLSGTTTKAAVLGVATFTGLSIDKTGTGYTLQAASGSLTPGTSAAFDITPAGATQLAFTVQPGPTAAGATISPAVKVTALDAFGNATGFTGNVTVRLGTNPGGGILSGTTTVAALAGVAIFSNLSINAPGTGYTLQATSGTRTPATSTAFDISGAPTRLAFTVQPSTTAAGAIVPAVQVTAQDALGNSAVDFLGSVTVSIGVNPSAGVLSGTMTVGAQAGVATFSDLRIDKAGLSYTLEAASLGLVTGSSAAFDITTAIGPVQPGVAAGWFHTCALRSDGSVVCWGSNTYPEAPVQPFLGQATPPPGVTFTQVSAGGYHTCGLKGDGTVACWGDNSNGAAPTSVTPPAGTTFTQVSAGASHTCALVSDGGLNCWGYDGYGQAPVSRAPPAGTTFTQISAGGYHTCARVSDGTVACYGRNDDGQATALSGTSYDQVGAGGFHTCALLVDGTATCWGNNFQSQATPPNGSTFIQLGAGAFHTCAVQSDHAIGCWGGNTYGQAGPPSGTTFTQVSGGYRHGCAVKSDGTVACWGDDTYGQATPPPGLGG